jgi:(p)ppGpp synthase/HD superfamily hydrolase
MILQLYSPRLFKAYRFAIRTHEEFQMQKRKVKDVPFIVRPLAVALILSRAGASENLVIAGLLHDAIEDSVAHKKAASEMIAERFGETVASLVHAVTEQKTVGSKPRSWHERKAEALTHVAHLSADEVLLKSADVIASTTEIIDDVECDGDAVFARFNATKAGSLEQLVKMIDARLERLLTSPLASALKRNRTALVGMGEQTGVML